MIPPTAQEHNDDTLLQTCGRVIAYNEIFHPHHFPSIHSLRALWWCSGTKTWRVFSVVIQGCTPSLDGAKAWTASAGRRHQHRTISRAMSNPLSRSPPASRPAIYGSRAHAFANNPHKSAPERQPSRDAIVAAKMAGEKHAYEFGGPYALSHVRVSHALLTMLTESVPRSALSDYPSYATRSPSSATM